jgi:hypothetical protein
VETADDPGFLNITLYEKDTFGLCIKISWIQETGRNHRASTHCIEKVVQERLSTELGVVGLKACHQNVSRCSRVIPPAASGAGACVPFSKFGSCRWK